MMTPTRRDEQMNNAGEPWQSATPNRTSDSAVEKIPFEAGKSRYSELPGAVSLYVGSTDLRSHSVSGWIWVADTHRHIWLRDQKAGEPVILPGSQGGQRRELVITGVSKSSATGYLLLPRESAQLH